MEANLLTPTVSVSWTTHRAKQEHGKLKLVKQRLCSIKHCTIYNKCEANWIMSQKTNQFKKMHVLSSKNISFILPYNEI